jgi:CRP-like cAMP-binding protein
MVGCTRQSVNKLLGQFTDDGLIRLEREGIVVTDLDGLTATSRR